MSRIIRRRVPGFLSVLSLTLASMFVSVEPASAAVPGLERVIASKVSNSVSPTSATATCPPGKRVIGTGALINDGQGQVVIDDITPNSALTEVLVTGHEDADGFVGNWTVNAIAICANPLPGIQRISGTAGFDSNSPKTAHSQCPGSQQLIGLGAEITDARGHVTLETMPGKFPGDNDGFANAFEMLGGSSRNWAVTVHLICANSGLAGQQLVSTVSQFTSGSKGVITNCPGGKKVVSTGFSIVQGHGQAILDDLRPSADLTNVRAGAPEDQDGQSGVWSIRAFAVCATP